MQKTKPTVDLLYKDEVYAIVGAAMEVDNELGPGFAENIYQEALAMELRERNIPFVEQQPIQIMYKGKKPLMEKTLQNKIAIVTGGAQGLGAALCERLAREGAHVVVADLNLEGATQTAAKIATQTGRRARAVQVDVTDEAQVAAMVDRTVAEFGRLDILVSNAGILISGAADEFDVKKWQAVINVNLVGYFLVAKHAIRVMRPHQSGVIIQINSKSGKKGSYKNSAYAASKFGGIGLTQSLALELAEEGIRVNAVCPGNLLDSPLWTESLFKQYARNQGITEEEVRQKYIDQVPMKRGCTYDDVCNVVAFLASDQSSYMTGQAINVTGGQEMR